MKKVVKKKSQSLSEFDLRRWCIEKALDVYIRDKDGNLFQAEPIVTAQRIYDWVKK